MFVKFSFSIEIIFTIQSKLISNSIKNNNIFIRFSNVIYIYKALFCLQITLFLIRLSTYNFDKFP